MGESEHYYDGREFSPASRYAANQNPGVRWHDTETGQEHFALAVGIEDLLDAGADVTDPEDGTQVVKRVTIGPNKLHGGWTVRVSYLTADPHERDGRIAFVGTSTYTGAESFEDRTAAVEFSGAECDAFAEAEVRDAAEWYRNVLAEREDDDA